MLTAEKATAILPCPPLIVTHTIKIYHAVPAIFRREDVCCRPRFIFIYINACFSIMFRHFARATQADRAAA